MSVKISEFVSYKAGALTGGLALYPGVILPSMDDMISGPEVLRKVSLSLMRQNHVMADRAQSEASPVVAYDGLLLKFTEFGALDILQNVDNRSVDELDLDEESDATELFAHIFETGPVIIVQNQIGISAAVAPIRSEWSRVVSFLEPGVSFLENNVKAQYSSIKVEVG